MDIHLLPLDKEYIWISALETSGDLHGGNLMCALQEEGCEYSFIGIGGTNMCSQGLQDIFTSDEFSVMGLVEVISHIPKIIRSYRRITSIFSRFKIKAVILIDAPDFHFRIAKMAWRLGIPVFYYISPQVWAWRKGRIKFLKKYITKLCCIFPFEKDFFMQHGLEVEYVGHPLIETLKFDEMDNVKKDKNSLILMPGSRVKEVKSILPIVSRACDMVSKKWPNINIKIIRAPNIPEQIIQQGWQSSMDYEAIEFKNRYHEMARSEMAIVASGTASLECGLLRLPAIVVYKVSLPTYLIGKLFVSIDYVSMTNIILNRKVYPELIQKDFTPENISNTILLWKSNLDILTRMREDLLALREEIGTRKASKQTAKIILKYLSG